MKSVLRKIFGIYCLLVVTILVIIFIPVYYITFTVKAGSRDKDQAGHRVTRTASKILFFFYGIKVKVSGVENVDLNSVYIFVSNHTSLLDVPAVVIAAPFTFKFLAKSELTKIPLFGYIINNLYLSVNRKDKEARSKSMDEMKACLNRGISIYIFPEGTRNKTNEPLSTFYDGAFRLALASGKPIAVCSILNSKKLLNNYDMQPGTIECVFDKPIEISANDTVESLKEKTTSLILQRIGTIDG